MLSRFLVLLCLLAGVCLPAFANTPDELDRTIAACGKPVRVKSLPSPRGEPTNFIRKDVYFKSIDMMFMRGEKGYWELVGTFSAGGNDALDKTAAVALMPCLNQVVYLDKTFERPAQAPAATTATPKHGDGDWIPGFALVLFALYFLPAILAGSRGMDKVNGVVVLNIFLGWTLIGWVIALIWAVSGETRKQAEQRAAVMAYALNAQNLPPR